MFGHASGLTDPWDLPVSSERASSQTGELADMGMSTVAAVGSHLVMVAFEQLCAHVLHLRRPAGGD